MKQVVFINPPTPGFRKITRNVDCASESKGNYLLQPFDFLLLTGTFQRETPIHFIDAVAEMMDVRSALDRLQALKPDLIITAIIDAAWNDDLGFIRSLRAQHPDVPILAFGDALMEESNAAIVSELVDGIIVSPLLLDPSPLKKFTRGEVEQNRALMGLRSSRSFVAESKTPTRRSILLPRHELFLHPRYRWPFATYRRYTTVMVAWGCPYSCSYCTSSKLPSLFRSHDEVLAELAAIKRLGVQEIYFGDKSFGVPSENAKALLRGMVQADFRFSWSTYFHPAQFSPEFLELMKAAGCHTIIVGIESEDVDSLSRFGRRIKKEKIEGMVRYANELKINVCGDFLFGLPGEDRQAILSTIRYSLRLDIDFASFNIAAPLPGSIVKRRAIEDGRMAEDDHHFDSVGKGRVLASDKVGADDLENLRNMAVRKFYLRPKYLLKRLSRLRGIEHLWIQLGEMFEVLRKARRA